MSTETGAEGRAHVNRSRIALGRASANRHRMIPLGRASASRHRIPLALVIGFAAIGCDAGHEIERPAPLFTESPVEYPLEMWDGDVEGSTVVRVLVDEEGGVDSVTVAESSGHAALDSAAVRGARDMRFSPAMRGGEPLRVWSRVPVHFVKDPLGRSTDGPADGDRSGRP